MPPLFYRDIGGTEVLDGGGAVALAADHFLCRNDAYRTKQCRNFQVALEILGTARSACFGIADSVEADAHMRVVDAEVRVFGAPVRLFDAPVRVASRAPSSDLAGLRAGRRRA